MSSLPSDWTWAVGAVHQRIVAEFGVDILTDGVIDRDKLGKVVFADPSKRRKLDKAVLGCGGFGGTVDC